jgi:hypothetical protein
MIIKVGRKDIAEIFGYNEKYINELVKEKGAPHGDDHNEYNLIKWIQWNIIYIKKQYEAELEKIKATTPQDLLASKNAILKDLDIREREGELVIADSVRASWLNEQQMIKSNVDLCEINLKQRIKDVAENKEKEEIITSEFIKLKNKIANSTVSISEE